uniref:Flavoprotein involved in K+ transport-like protein n=1 Tax=Ectopseudomonas mendocina (strain ymp) TaxID=399739 RepID=A4XTI7_ECTM1
MHNNPRTGAPWRVLIIGSGFAGLGLAMQLRRAGEDDFLILEKAADVGGTWRDNHYPGAACDVPSHLYSFSFEPKHDWSRKFAPQAEIHAYIRQCVDNHRLRPHIRLNAEVRGAEFDAERGLWRVELVGGEHLEAQALVSACGQLNRPAYPALPGLENFRGEAFHSARWRHDLDLSGKRVAVIGTGASAIQFVPQIQPKVAQLSLFQRSAAYVLAKPDRAYRAWEIALMRRVPLLQRADRLLKYLHHEVRALAFISMPWVMRLMRGSFTRHLARQMPDAAKRARLQPDYPMGCKRILISNDYFPALAQANVDIVDSAISEVREHSLVTADGREHPCDVLIYGTGFTASDFLAPMRIRGLGGLELNQAWKEGAEAYKGISVSGFPNLFLLYGPNTNLGHSSILYMLESQYRYVLGCLRTLREQQLRYLDLRMDVQRRYNQRLQHATRRTIWAQGCSSWYQNASGKHTNNWPGYTFTYRHLTRTPELADYDRVR